MCSGPGGRPGHTLAPAGFPLLPPTPTPESRWGHAEGRRACPAAVTSRDGRGRAPVCAPKDPSSGHGLGGIVLTSWGSGPRAPRLLGV